MESAIVLSFCLGVLTFFAVVQAYLLCEYYDQVKKMGRYLSRRDSSK